jgi:hypothetical protein
MTATTAVVVVGIMLQEMINIGPVHLIVNRNRDRTACKVQRLVVAVGRNVLCMVSSGKERDRLRRQRVINIIIINNSTFIVEFNTFFVGFIVF